MCLYKQCRTVIIDVSKQFVIIRGRIEDIFVRYRSLKYNIAAVKRIFLQGDSLSTLNHLFIVYYRKYYSNPDFGIIIIIQVGTQRVINIKIPKYFIPFRVYPSATQIQFSNENNLFHCKLLSSSDNFFENLELIDFKTSIPT